MNDQHVPDEEILSAIERRLAAVEPLVPVPPAWRPRAEGATGEPGTLQPRVRSTISSGLGLSFGGLALVAVFIVLAAVVIGPLGRVGVGGTATRSPSIAATPTAPPAAAPTLVYRIVVPDGTQAATAELDLLKTVVQRRLDAFGFGGSATIGSDASGPTLIVRPQSADLMSVEDTIGTTGRLEFVPLPRVAYGYMDMGSSTNVAGTEPVPNDGDDLSPELARGALKPLLSNDAFASFRFVEADPATGAPVIAFKLTAAGTSRLAEYTSANVGDYFAIVFDGRVVSAPYISGPVTGGEGQVSGQFTKASAELFAKLLQSGALPFPIQQLGVDAPSPTPLPSNVATLPPAPTLSPTPPIETIIRGTVQDARSVTPVPLAGATVRLLPYGLTATSAADGSFSFEIPIPRCVLVDLEVTAPGFGKSTYIGTRASRGDGPIFTVGLQVRAVRQTSYDAIPDPACVYASPTPR